MLSLLTSALLATVTLNCSRSTSEPRMTEADAIQAAKPELTARFSNFVATYEPYHAELQDGEWHVFGTLPNGKTRGGTPQATVRDSDGKVIEASHGK